jgi:hypothetical protein
VYVSELWWRIGQKSLVNGDVRQDKSGRVTVFDRSGQVLARWGGTDRVAAGNFIAPHDIGVDSRGDVYVAEVTKTFAISSGALPPGEYHTFQKFARQR